MPRRQPTIADTGQWELAWGVGADGTKDVLAPTKAVAGITAGALWKGEKTVREWGLFGAFQDYKQRYNDAVPPGEEPKSEQALWQEFTKENPAPTFISALPGLNDMGGGVVSYIGNMIDLGLGFKALMEGKGRDAFDKVLQGFGGSLAGVAKYLKGGLGVAVAAGAKGGWKTLKDLLGPIPPAIESLVTTFKLVVLAVREKGKAFKDLGKKKQEEALTLFWTNIKSLWSTARSTVTTLFKLTKAAAPAIPIFGALADLIDAIISVGEGIWQFIRKAKAMGKSHRLLSRLWRRVKTIAKERRPRLMYLVNVTRKRAKNLVRAVYGRMLKVAGGLIKGASAITSLISEIIAAGAVTSPGAAIGKLAGVIGSVAGSVTALVGTMLESVPKALSRLRQIGRDIAGGKGKVAGAFQWLGYSGEKSTAVKHEQRVEVVRGIAKDAADLDPYVDAAGKDPAQVEQEAKARLAQVTDLDLELEAAGVDKEKLFEHNKKKNLTERAQAQAELIYEALGKR